MKRNDKNQPDRAKSLELLEQFDYFFLNGLIHFIGVSAHNQNDLERAV